MKEWTPQNDTLYDVFMSIESCCKVYYDYCSNHEKAYELYQSLLKRKKFAKLHKDICKTFNCVSFESFMITPVQRIPRYQIFLKDLIKHTYPGNSVYQKYQECIEKVKSTLTTINSQL